MADWNVSAEPSFDASIDRMGIQQAESTLDVESTEAVGRQRGSLMPPSEDAGRQRGSLMQRGSFRSHGSERMGSVKSDSQATQATSKLQANPMAMLNIANRMVGGISPRGGDPGGSP